MCLHHKHVQIVLRRAATHGFGGREAGASLQLPFLYSMMVGAPPPSHRTSSSMHTLLLAGRGLMMPRELQAASTLPSQEQWGHCGRPGKCGQIPCLAVTRWVGPHCHSGRRRAPWNYTWPARRRNSMPACPVALLSSLAPTNLPGYKTQSDSQQRRAASAADLAVSRRRSAAPMPAPHLGLHQDQLCSRDLSQGEWSRRNKVLHTPKSHLSGRYKC